MGENDISTFSRLLLVRSFLYLQVTRTCKKSQTSSKFWPDRTTDYLSILKIPHRFIMEKGVFMLPCSFLMESSSKLLVTRTGVKARSNSSLGGIRPLILELLALSDENFTLLNLYISEASWPFIIKFYV